MGKTNDKDFQRFREQWKKADKLFRLPWYKRPFGFIIYRRQLKKYAPMVNEILEKMPTPRLK